MIDETRSRACLPACNLHLVSNCALDLLEQLLFGHPRCRRSLRLALHCTAASILHLARLVDLTHFYVECHLACSTNLNTAQDMHASRTQCYTQQKHCLQPVYLCSACTHIL